MHDDVEDDLKISASNWSKLQKELKEMLETDTDVLTSLSRKSFLILANLK